jgi:hypothetical protein
VALAMNDNEQQKDQQQQPEIDPALETDLGQKPTAQELARQRANARRQRLGKRPLPMQQFEFTGKTTSTGDKPESEEDKPNPGITREQQAAARKHLKELGIDSQLVAEPAPDAAIPAPTTATNGPAAQVTPEAVKGSGQDLETRLKRVVDESLERFYQRLEPLIKDNTGFGP